MILGKMLAPLAAAAVAWASGAHAADQEISGEVAVVSDYVSRSLSYSDGHGAVQGYVSWGNAAGVDGLHVGGWVSSVDFGPGDPAKAELWGTVGYGGGVGVFTYDAGLEYTTYPGAPKALHYSYYDAFASLGAAVGPVAATATARFTPDYSGATGRAAFVDLAGEVPVGPLFKATAIVGYADLRPAAGGAYLYWNAGLAADWLGFTAAVRYHGSDLAACQSRCGDRVVFSFGKAF
jgi:uncharacterized protein (TIGR02001 family)